MDVIANGFEAELEKKILRETLKKINCKRALIISSQSADYLKDTVASVESLKYKLAKHAEYPPPNFKLEAFDRETIESFSHCEVIVLKMMDRIDRVQGRISMEMLGYEERKQMYLKHLRYWNSYLRRYQISLFITNGTPHISYDFVIYSICRKLNIPTVIVCGTQIDGIYVLGKTIEEQGFDIGDELAGSAIGSSQSRKIVWDLIQKHTDWMTSEKRSRPIGQSLNLQYIKNDERNIGFRKVGILARKHGYHVLQKLVKTKWLERESKRAEADEVNYQRVCLNKELRSFYRSVSVKPDFTKKYIYAPLAIQPENSTCPLAGVFNDQFLFVEMISDALPDNMMLFVKEHVRIDCRTRSNDYYKKIAALRNVVLIQQESSSLDLVKNSLAVATPSGSAGWEALFYQKPVLISGRVFYQYASGVYYVDSKNGAASIIKKIKDNEITIRRQDLDRFLTRLGQCAVIGPTVGVSSEEMLNLKWNANQEAAIVEHSSDMMWDYIKREAFLKSRN